MSDIAIRVEDLSKLYRIGEHQGGYKTLRETIVNTFSAPFRHLHRNPQSSILNPQSDFIWALKDISFDVKRGEVLGIIGRNGAGKTTLLKILSRITEPTEGWGEIRGRVGSLLEVGTGFHPELTGRENIYLNGAILGMKKAEIDRRFDEIVAFAEISKFIDTPVKRYSSGMYVRLAFAVAAHLEPEILLVDEVLAVGDVAFQKKCLGKMGEVAGEGRTVLFVSHNMSAVTRLCSRGVLLEDGRIQKIGSAREAVATYLRLGGEIAGECRWDVPEYVPRGEGFYIRAVRVRDSTGAVSAHIDSSFPFQVEIEHVVERRLPTFRLCFRLLASDGSILFQSCDNCASEFSKRQRLPGVYISHCVIPGGLLNDGHYTLSISADIPFVKIFFVDEHVLTFEVVQTAPTGGRFIERSERWPGLINPELTWEIEKL